VVDGDAVDVWWWPLDLGWAETEVVEDCVDRELIVDGGDDLERPPASATGERVGVIDLADQPRPGEGAAAFLGDLGGGSLEPLLLLDPSPRARLA
jgi:hypothetical protein